jgi:Rer1 family
VLESWTHRKAKKKKKLVRELRANLDQLTAVYLLSQKKNQNQNQRSMENPSSSASAPAPAATAADSDLASPVREVLASLSCRYQHLLDRATPFVRERWLGFGCLVLLYLLRVWLLEGFYIVTYALGIYSLGQLVAFLSPMVDPEIQELIDGSSPSLPTRSTDEFRPFVRRLPEFKFWY